MEIIIAIGLGAWFVFTGTLSAWSVFNSFKDVKEEEKK